MSSPIPSANALVRNADVIATDMDGETVMMNMERGEYLGLGGVGARVWELLAQPMSLEQLVQAVCAEFEVDAATCRADLQAFVDDLRANGLLARA